MTLTEFLLARIAEDEAEAQSALRKRRDIRYIEGHPAADPGFEDHELTAYEDLGVPAVVVGCERVLADCEAKRRLVKIHGGDYDGECQSPAHLDGPCRTLRALATAYASHPDYNEAWRP